MLNNKGDKLNDLLMNFGMRAQMHATAIVSRDGFIIASIMDDSGIGFNGSSLEDDLIGSMAAEMITLGERTTEELLNTNPQRVIIDSELGTIVLVTAGRDAVIISVIERENLGMILLHLQRLANEVEKMLFAQNQ